MAYIPQRFREVAPECVAAAAGPLPEMPATEGTGFPAGKGSMLDFRPLTNSSSCDGIDDFGDWPLIDDDQLNAALNSLPAGGSFLLNDCT